MALERSPAPAVLGASPFRPDLPPEALANIEALARSAYDNANEPFHALSVLHQLLRAMDLSGSVPVFGLVLLIEPVLAQLDLLRADAYTLNHLLTFGEDS